MDREENLSRIALLPSRGDPFALYLTYYFFKEIWHDEVSKLRILVNSPVEEEVIDFIRKFTARGSPKVIFSYVDHPLDHGPALTKMFNDSWEDIVIFAEDDSIIFKKGVVDQYCRMIEEGKTDCVGSRRWSCCEPLIEVTRKRFDLTDSKYLGGAHFWPCFFFARRSDLKRTDLNFGARNWKKGEYNPALDWVAARDVSADTLGWMAQQLRALGLRFHDVEQYHGNLADLEYYKNKTFLFDGKCPWLHNGTLSSAIEDIFTDDRNIPLARRKDPTAQPCLRDTMPAEKGEMERRLAWAVLAIEHFWNEFEEIAEFRNLYKGAILKYIGKFNLDIERIKELIKIYKELIGLRWDGVAVGLFFQ